MYSEFKIIRPDVQDKKFIALNSAYDTCVKIHAHTHTHTQTHTHLQTHTSAFKQTHTMAALSMR